MQDDDGLVVKKRNKTTNEAYIIDFMVGAGRPDASVAVSAPNKESVAATASIIVAVNWPNLIGFNLYRHNPAYEYDREFLMHVPAMQLLTTFMPEIQKQVGAQVLKGVIPVVPQKLGGEDLKKLSDEAKKDGKQLF